MQEIRFTLTNKLGLHARPASLLAQTSSKFKSTVTIEGKGKTVNTKSVILLMTLGFGEGTDCKIAVEGEDETECMEAIKNLVDNTFFEKE